MLHTDHPCLIAVGGKPGVGKTTLAQYLSLLTDRVFFIDPPKGETDAVLIARVREGLQDGGRVVISAPLDTPAQREKLEIVAAQAGVPFQGIWLYGEHAKPVEAAAPRKILFQEHRAPASLSPAWMTLNVGMAFNHLARKALCGTRLMLQGRVEVAQPETFGCQGKCIPASKI